MNIKWSIVILFFSGLAALLCTGTLIFLFGLSFWVLDDFVFNFLNLPPKFEYDVLSFLRSAFFWLEDAHFTPTFFALWVVILFMSFRNGWVKKKLILIKEKL
jgi:hypothetical protein